MRRLHFYVMGLISLAYGVLASAEFLFVSLRGTPGWLDMYPPDQIAWLNGLPTWVYWVWGAHCVLALVGALCLLAHVQSAVWMLAFSFLTLLAVLVWAFGFAVPALPDLVGTEWPVYTIAALVAALSLLVYLYARHEKRLGEVL